MKAFIKIFLQFFFGFRHTLTFFFKVMLKLFTLMKNSSVLSSFFKISTTFALSELVESVLFLFDRVREKYILFVNYF